MKKTYRTPLNLKFDFGWIRLFLVILLLSVVIFMVPYLLWRYPIYDPLYQSYTKEKSGQAVDTRLEYQIRLLQAVAWVVGVSGFFIGFWSSRRDGRKAAYQRLVENQLSLMQDQLTNDRLMQFFQRIDKIKINFNKPFDRNIEDLEYFHLHLAKAMVIWEQLFMFKVKGWIDLKTWRYWDRQLREVYIGQLSKIEYPYNNIIHPPQYRDTQAAKTQAVTGIWYYLFVDWWHERQNYRYYHIDFIRYVYSIIIQSNNKLTTRDFLDENENLR